MIDNIEQLKAENAKLRAEIERYLAEIERLKASVKPKPRGRKETGIWRGDLAKLRSKILARIEADARKKLHSGYYNHVESYAAAMGWTKQQAEQKVKDHLKVLEDAGQPFKY